MLAGQNRGLWIMSCPAICETETGEDSRSTPDCRQWTDPHGFHFLEDGLGAAGAAPEPGNAGYSAELSEDVPGSLRVAKMALENRHLDVKLVEMSMQEELYAKST